MIINTFRLRHTLLALLFLCMQLGFSQNPCSGPDYRAFDFWIGDWEVYNPKGDKVGVSNIKLALDSCMIFESWNGNGVFKGNSINYYDFTDKLWKQKWIDNFGSALEFTGQAAEREMKYVCTSVNPKSAELLYNIMTITKISDDEVKQVWQQSGDSVNWKVVFDGLYKRIRKDKGITAVYDTFSIAYKTLNPKLVGNLYHEEAYYLNSKGITYGGDAILENFKGFFNRLNSRSIIPQIEFKIVHRALDDNLAADIGYYLLTYVENGEVSSKHAGRFTTTLIKNENDQWKFISDSYTEASVDDFLAAKPIK